MTQLLIYRPKEIKSLSLSIYIYIYIYIMLIGGLPYLWMKRVLYHGDSI